MADRRHANVAWHVADTTGDPYSSMRDGKSLAVLMDIRDALQNLNALLYCHNFRDIPHKLERITENTRKPVRKRKRKAVRR